VRRWAVSWVHTAVEVQRAIDCGARVIGINNRNLDTLTIDLAATEQLAPLIPPSTSCISESGIQCTEDVARVRSAGARGVLVGAALLRAHDVHAMIRSFKQALQ
jgi:indole-3-glycerol phosphate synthase